MCEPISIIMSADSWHGPRKDAWDHSHSAIMKAAGVPDSLAADKWARVEVAPPDGRWREDDNSVRADVDTWPVRLDEQRKPGWWADDEPAQIERARRYAAQWLAGCDHRLVPGLRAIGGDYSTLTGGHGSTLTGGEYSALVWRLWRNGRIRFVAAYVGEDGIEANVPYTLDCDGKPKRAKGGAS